MDSKTAEVPNDFKTQVDNMFKEFNVLIDDVSSKLSNISKAVAELEAKLASPAEEDASRK